MNGGGLSAARAALARGDVILAYDAASEVLLADPADLEARYVAALALVRAGARERARLAIDDLHAALAGAEDVRPGLREDAEALEGRLAKELALAARGVERAQLAATAAKLYEAVADRYDRYFTCINAATLWLVAGDTARAHALAERARALVRAVADEPGEGYWAAATDAEAALVLGDVEGAQAALEIAATMGAGDVAARAVTARQLRVLCETAGIDPGILDALALPGVLHFCGHRVTADAEKAGGFAADDEPAVAAAVRDFLSNRSFDGAYGALACGADIIIAEAALEHGVPLHVVLPFGIDDFEEVSVRSGGAGWPERYRSCLERAASVFVAYDSAYIDDPGLFGFATKVAMGQALHHAQHLGVEAEQLAVWDGEGSDSEAGTGHDVTSWRAGNRLSHVVPVHHQRARREQGPRDERATRRQLGAMLFTDVRGFSSLKDEHQRAFVEGILGPMGAALDAFGAGKVQYRNTWGDAILAVCADVATTAAAALALQGLMKSIDLEALGLPDTLAMRVGAHVGTLITLDDPVRHMPAFWGRELTRAARIEPRTPAGEVYVTEAFAAVCTLECGTDFACEYVGRVTTAKEFETIPMYRLRYA
jgi:Adenylate and Guanylate cyclase catalytic domain/Tetratricopeptide Repeats-Sensor